MVRVSTHSLKQLVVPRWGQPAAAHAANGHAIATTASLRVMVSAVNIEAAPFQIQGQLLAGGPGVDGGGVQGFVAQQAGQFHQLARGTFPR